MLKIKWYIIKELPYCLLHFLIEKEVLSKFVNNLKTDIQQEAISKNIPVSTAVANVLASIRDVPDKGILQAYVQIDTPEGHIFWDDLNWEFWNNIHTQLIKI